MLLHFSIKRVQNLGSMQIPNQIAVIEGFGNENLCRMPLL